MSPKVAGGCRERRTTNKNCSSPQWLYLHCSHGPLPFLLASPIWAEVPGQAAVEKGFPGSCLHPFHIPGKPWWSDVPQLSSLFPTTTSLLPPASTLGSLVSLQGPPPAMGCPPTCHGVSPHATPQAVTLEQWADSLQGHPGCLH